MSTLKKLTRSSVALSVFVLTACSTVGPDFRRPNVLPITHFAFVPDRALMEAAGHEWWQELNDPVLDRVIERALKQNLDLEAAQSRIREARALLGTVGLRSQLKGDGGLRANAAIEETGETRTSASGDFKPSFIVDLFGGQRRAQEAAIARTTAAEFDRPAVQLALLLEVVSAYLELRQLEAEIRVRKSTIAAQERIAAAVKARLNEGEATKIGLRNAEAELAVTKAQLPAISAARDTVALRLATLLSEPPQVVMDDLSHRDARQPVPGSYINPGVPAALLKNRPDIQRAEARYAAAVAEIGVAKSKLYPSLRIGGTLQVGAENSLGISPVLSIPLLNRGELKAETAAARERAIQARISWKKAVLNAVEEVQAALVRLQRADQQMILLKESVRANAQAASLAREAFELGELTVDEILEAEVSASAARVNLTSAKRIYAENWARLNLALGMGWHSE